MQADSLFLKEEENFWRAPMKAARFVVLGVVVIAALFLLFSTKPWTVSAAAAERAAAGEKPLLEHDVKRGLWFAAAAVVAAGGFLLGTWRRWCHPLSTKARTPPTPSESLPVTVFWLLVLGAVVLGGLVRWNLATRGLWWDELWALRHASLGYLKPVGEAETSELRFLKRDWSATVWGYRKPTNHPQASVASRISQTVWRSRSGAKSHEFNSLAVRAPALLAGLLSVVAIAVLVRRWGFAIGGVTAAFFLALHPWHMRYGTEMRGYSFAVLWTILGCYWLSKALNDQARWRYWLLFGLNQLLLTWCLPNGFYYAAAFTLAGAVACWRRWSGRTDRITAIWRLIAVNTMAAMAFFPLFLPNVLQALRWGEINDFAYLTGSRLLDALCHLAFGMKVSAGSGPEQEGIPSFEAELTGSPLGAWPIVVLLVISVLAGCLRLCRERRSGAILLGAVLGAALVSLAVTKLANQFFYPRYIIYTLVPLTALFGIGLSGFARAVSPRGAPAVFIGLAALGLYFYATRDARALLISRPYAPFEEVAQHLEKRVAKEPALRSIGYGLGGRMLAMYYPRARFAKNKGHLEREIAEADAAGVPYVLILGYEAVNRGSPEYGDGFEIIDKPGAFTVSRHFAGIDPMFYFKVLDPLPPST